MSGLGRLALVGAAWAVLSVVFVAALTWSAALRSRVKPPDPSLLTRALTSSQPAAFRWGSWTVLRATSAQRALIVDVEAVRLHESRAIAAQIVEPVRDRFDEILIYFRPAGRAEAESVRRIQWTKADGYRELILGN